MSVNNERRKLGQCTYCGENRSISDDHVIPDCLFPKPVPADMQELITVYACDQCNHSFSKHQDYLRDVLVTDHFASNNASAQTLMQSKFIRSVQRNRSQFARQAVTDRKLEAFKTPGGLYLGHLYTVPLQSERFTFLFSMMVRGLYFSKFGERLPENCLIDIERIHPSSRNELWQKIEQVRGVNGPHVWGDVFACLVIRTIEEPSLTAWYLLFYESLLFVVSTRPPTYDVNFNRLSEPPEATE